MTFCSTKKKRSSNQISSVKQTLPYHSQTPNRRYDEVWYFTGLW